MKINGIVKSVSPEYPFTVTMNNGQVFTSHFQFTKGQKVKLNFTGEVFTHPWSSGFVHCDPNGQSDYTLSPERVKAAKDPNSLHCQYDLELPLRQAVITGEKQSWSNVWSFYTYHYTAIFNPATNVLTTNYAIRGDF
jgi:hypothetical protein